MGVPFVEREYYWNLFWQTGLPEAWLMSRPMENDLFIAEMAARDLRLPTEARQLRQRQEETSAPQGVSSAPSAE